jgi:hypothetical protein
MLGSASAWAPAVRMQSSLQLLFCAYPIGYGPSAKALVLASLCRQAGMRAVFVGRGISHELTVRSDGIFDEVVRAGADDEVSRRLVGESCAVVSIMDRDFAALARKLSKPLHVVDSLFWMRDRVPEPFAFAGRYWVQDFPGVRDLVGTAGGRPTVVGPIVDVRPRRPRRASGKLVVSLGGFEAVDDAERDRVYGELVVRSLAASKLTALTRQVTVLASARIADYLEREAARCGFEVVSLSHDAALDELAAASLVLVAPGLTTTLECFQLGCPTVFLPPRNYSQWCILKALRSRDLAPYALHWEDLSSPHRLGNRLPEEQRDPQVREAIVQLGRGLSARAMLTRNLSSCLDIDRDELARRQHAFFKSLGPNGAPAIAAQLVSEFAT